MTDKTFYDINYKQFTTMAALLIRIKGDHLDSDNFSGTTDCPFCGEKVGYAFLNGGCQFKSMKCVNKKCALNYIWLQIERMEKEEETNVEETHTETTIEIPKGRSKANEERNTGTAETECTSECRLR